MDGDKIVTLFNVINKIQNTIIVKPGQHCIVFLFIFLAASTPTIVNGASISTSSDTFTIALAASDYNYDGTAQIEKQNAHTITLTASGTWELFALPRNGSFIYDGNYIDPNKLESNLEVKTASQSTSKYTALNASDSVVVETYTDPSSKQVDIDYNFHSDLSNDPPGFYSLTIDYYLQEQ